MKSLYEHTNMLAKIDKVFALQESKGFFKAAAITNTNIKQILFKLSQLFMGMKYCRYD